MLRQMAPHILHLPTQRQKGRGLSELPGRNGSKTKCQSNKQRFVHGHWPFWEQTGGKFHHNVCNLIKAFSPVLSKQARTQENMIQVQAFVPGGTQLFHHCPCRSRSRVLQKPGMRGEIRVPATTGDVGATRVKTLTLHKPIRRCKRCDPPIWYP
jgi:hypothetical protein